MEYKFGVANKAYIFKEDKLLLIYKTKEEAKDDPDPNIRIDQPGLKKLDIADEYAIINEERSNHFHTWFFPRLTWMDNFGHSISEVRNIMKYAQQNMNNDNNIKEVMNYIKEAKKIVASNN